MKAIRKYDPNYMYVGCRFNQEQDELNNPTIFKVAVKYMDMISINHYLKWDPIESIINNWVTWSGKLFLITKWHTKSEDSGLPNNIGTGWNVPTQQDLSYFYQNFTIELLKNNGYVNWHWFTYHDNDPYSLKTGPSNTNYKKGTTDRNYEFYMPLIINTKALNDHTFQLIKYPDKPIN